MRAEINLGRIEPHPWLSAPWRCWHELASDRVWLTEGIGGGLGPIRIFPRPQPLGWSVVTAWAAHEGILAREDVADLFACVRAMDRVYVAHVNRQIEAELKKMTK